MMWWLPCWLPKAASREVPGLSFVVYTVYIFKVILKIDFPNGQNEESNSNRLDASHVETAL